jgi:ankyrin repeat protein
MSAAAETFVAAAMAGDEAGLAALLGAGADANLALPDGTTALTAAAAASQNGTLGLLLRHGAAVDAPNPADGASPLWIAAFNGNAAGVRLLREAGASSAAANHLGVTPREAALQGGHLGIAAIL